MTKVTYYISLPFIKDAVHGLVSGAPLQSPNAELAKHRAMMMSRSGNNIGALAFSRTGDRDTACFEDAVILDRYGETPGDMK